MPEQPFDINLLHHESRISSAIGAKLRVSWWIDWWIDWGIRARTDGRLYWHEGTDDISINFIIGVLILNLMRPVREALIPDVEECTLHVVVHPWSICVDILSKLLECHVQFLQISNHPALNLSAVAVVVVEHPDAIVISHTLMWWVRVVEPVNEIVIDCFIAIDDMLGPSLFVVAHWSWFWDWKWLWCSGSTTVLLIFLKQNGESIKISLDDTDLSVRVNMRKASDVYELIVKLGGKLSSTLQGLDSRDVNRECL
jgi:hypothetical protein